MTQQRQNSLDPLKIEKWRWQPFLDHAIDALQPFGLEPYPIAPEFLLQTSETGSKSKPIHVTTATWACSSKKLRQIRAACVEAGSAASVLNFVINPLTTYDLPFFGADLVTLPAGHLLALDLQPALKGDKDHTDKVWSQLMPIFERWQALLPGGGPIPEEAQPYFSPGFLWTRIPLGEEGDASVADFEPQQRALTRRVCKLGLNEVTREATERNRRAVICDHIEVIFESEHDALHARNVAMRICLQRVA